MTDDLFLCLIDVVDLYANISHDDDLAAITNALHKRTDKTVSPESLKKLTVC